MIVLRRMAVCAVLLLVLLAACAAPERQAPPLDGRCYTFSGTCNGLSLAGTVQFRTPRDMTFCFSEPPSIAGIEMSVSDGGFSVSDGTLSELYAEEALPPSAFARLMRDVFSDACGRMWKAEGSGITCGGTVGAYDYLLTAQNGADALQSLAVDAAGLRLAFSERL